MKSSLDSIFCSLDIIDTPLQIQPYSLENFQNVLGKWMSVTPRDAVGGRCTKNCTIDKLSFKCDAKDLFCHVAVVCRCYSLLRANDEGPRVRQGHAGITLNIALLHQHMRIY